MNPSTPQRTRRVLIFSLAYLPKHVGGAEIAIKEITDRLAHGATAEGIPDIEFHLVTNRYDSTLPKVEKVGNVLVHRIGYVRKDPSMADLRAWPLHLNKFIYQFLAAWHALKLHRQYHYDAIWAMMAHSCGVPAAIFKLFKPEVRFLLTLQEGDPPKHIERTMLPLWPLFSLAFKKADMVQAISTFLGQWARRRGFEGPLVVIPNAVDTARFSQDLPARSIDEIKDNLGKRMGDVFLITTSRLVPKNAVDDVIRALPKLPPNVRFIVLGTGPEEARLRHLTARMNVVERVQFIGHVTHTELPKYLKASDIFIRPSRSEGMGNSFVEAMAAGLPVIATQEGGLSDFIFDEKRDPEKPVTGFAVDKDSPIQIAQQVLSIMEHPEKVRAVITTAKEMVLEKYDWSIIAKDMRIKIFEPLLNM